MNQLSRPMQIALGATLVFAVLWFAVLAPKDEVEPPIDTPVATTPQSEVGKTIQNAQDAADAASAEINRRSGVTGEETPGQTTESSGTAGNTQESGAGTGTDAKPASSARQRRADDTIKRIERDLEAGRAVVFFIGANYGREDQIVRRRLKNDINRRGGKVRLYTVDVRDIALYDGLIGDLQVVQAPSTVVIAPDKQAKVLGGLVSTERVDRLTSSALLSAQHNAD